MPFDVTRAYDEATQHRRSAHLDRRARPARCGKRWKAERRARRAKRTMANDYQKSRASTTVARPTRIAAEPAQPPGRRRRRRAGRSGAGDRSGAARHARSCCSTTTTGCRPARARSASPSARSRSSTGSAAAQRMVDKGVSWNVGKVFFQRRAGLPLQPAARGGPPAPGLHQPAAVLRRGLPLRARRGRCANLELRWKNKVVGADAARRSTSTLTVETPDGRYRLDGDYAGRLRRRAQSPVRELLGLESKGRRLPRPLPDRRRQDEGRLPDRALVLVRPAVPSATSRCCCTGSPTTSGASTSSSAGTPTRKRRSKPERVDPARRRRCSARTRSSTSSGSASTPSPACAWTSSATAA